MVDDISVELLKGKKPVLSIENQMQETSVLKIAREFSQLENIQTKHSLFSIWCSII